MDQDTKRAVALLEELVQDRGAGLVQGACKVFIVLVPVIVILIVYVSWLLFRTRY